MKLRHLHSTSRLLAAGLILFVFGVRSLIPQGFMPSGEHPFSVEICPEGFPAQLLIHGGHHHHGAGHAQMDHCVFGTACATGPLSHPCALAEHSLTEFIAATPSPPITGVVRLVYLPHSRGPPFLT